MIAHKQPNITDHSPQNLSSQGEQKEICSLSKKELSLKETQKSFNYERQLWKESTNFTYHLHITSSTISK